MIIANQIEVGNFFALKWTNRKPQVEFHPAIDNRMCSIEGYDILSPSFSFLCKSCLEISTTRLLAPFKLRGKEEYLCGRCVYSKLNSQEKAVYMLGTIAGPFYEEIPQLK